MAKICPRCGYPNPNNLSYNWCGRRLYDDSFGNVIFCIEEVQTTFSSTSYNIPNTNISFDNGRVNKTSEHTWYNCGSVNYKTGDLNLEMSLDHIVKDSREYIVAVNDYRNFYNLD